MRLTVEILADRLSIQDKDEVITKLARLYNLCGNLKVRGHQRVIQALASAGPFPFTYETIIFEQEDIQERPRQTLKVRTAGGE